MVMKGKKLHAQIWVLIKYVINDKNIIWWFNLLQLVIRFPSYGLQLLANYN